MALFFVLKLYIFKQNFILKEQKKERGGKSDYKNELVALL